MTKTRLLAVLAFLLVFPAVGRAGEQEAEEPTAREIKVQVKQYTTLGPWEVYAAARDNREADVQFEDTFEERTSVPDRVRSLRLGGRSYRVVVSFRTGAGLVCLVPTRSADTLKSLLGVSRDRTLTMGALNRSLVLNPGQTITVQGTILGTSGGSKYVLADTVATGEVQPPPAHREVHLFWPTRPEPRIITETGSHSFEFPCSHAEGQTATVDVEVQQMGVDRLAAEVSRRTAELEGLGRGSKSYGEYTADRIYRYAAAGDSIEVDFTDTLRSVLARPLPSSLASAPAYRFGRLGQIRVARVLETSNHIMLLIPDTWPTIRQQTADAVPGEQVRVRGTVVRPRGPYRRVLVDWVWFPGRRAGGDQGVWWVALQWPNARQPLVFWDDGRYTASGLPCQNVSGRSESMQVLISRFRRIEVPVRMPVPEGGAQPEGPEQQEQPEEGGEPESE